MQSRSDDGAEQFDYDAEVWDGLKRAIATSSGFQRWQLERSTEDPSSTTNLDYQVRRYLRETLETLAY